MKGSFPATILFMPGSLQHPYQNSTSRNISQVVVSQQINALPASAREGWSIAKYQQCL
jgi:hypothetical protein